MLPVMEYIVHVSASVSCDIEAEAQQMDPVQAHNETPLIKSASQ